MALQNTAINSRFEEVSATKYTNATVRSRGQAMRASANPTNNAANRTLTIHNARARGLRPTSHQYGGNSAAETANTTVNIRKLLLTPTSSARASRIGRNM